MLALFSVIQVLDTNICADHNRGSIRFVVRRLKTKKRLAEIM